MIPTAARLARLAPINNESDAARAGSARCECLAVPAASTDHTDHQIQAKSATAATSQMANGTNHQIPKAATTPPAVSPAAAQTAILALADTSLARSGSL